MSCLFNSLSYFLNENSYDIRQKICNYLALIKKITQNKNYFLGPYKTKRVIQLGQNQNTKIYRVTNDKDSMNKALSKTKH